VFYGSEEPPLRKEKGIKKRRIMDMCLRVSRAHFSKYKWESNKGHVSEGE
jgi:hypothetical protein